jgi:hypothetical protein
MSPAALAIGGLLAVVGLILYEQTKTAAASVSAPPSSVVSASSGQEITAKAPSQPQSSLQQAAQSLPQFSAADNPSIIDIGASASWNGQSWTCPNGDQPYYDPSLNAVYCVLPGVIPGSSAGPTDTVTPEPESFWDAIF